LVITAKHTPDGWNPEGDGEVNSKDPSFATLLMAVGFEDRLDLGSISLKTQNIATLQHLIDNASETNKKVLDEYMHAPPGIRGLMEFESTLAATSEDLTAYRYSRDNALDSPEILASVTSSAIRAMLLDFAELEQAISRDFGFLSAYRDSGFGMGMIRLTEIQAFIDLELSSALRLGDATACISVQSFVEAIRLIDSEYVSYYAEKQREETESKKK